MILWLVKFVHKYGINQENFYELIEIAKKIYNRKVVKDENERFVSKRFNELIQDKEVTIEEKKQFMKNLKELFYFEPGD
ncbi:MAG: hypothetical protein ACTSVI_08580 [Promethearchaeota archaeon]